MGTAEQVTNGTTETTKDSKIRREVAPTLDTNKRVDFEDEFELVIMRWRYLLQSPNPTNDRMAQFDTIVNSTTRKIWRRFKYAYGVTGYDMDDVKALGRVHLVSYIGQFGLLEHEDKLVNFIKGFIKKNEKEPTEQEILRKDRANCASFLYQRLEESAKICAQKNRNIRGTDGVKCAYIGDFLVDAPAEAIMDNPAHYGLTKLTKKRTEELEAISTLKTDVGFVAEGKHVRVIDTSPKPMTEVDATELFYNSKNSLFLMDPLETMEYFAEAVRDEEIKNIFEGLETDKRKELLKEFLDDNKGNPKMAEELKAARDMISQL